MQKPIIKTNLGKAYHTDCLKFMKQMEPKSVDLIVTSPPYAMTKKKEYGNVSEDEYIDWFRPFAKLFRKILKPTASLVLNLGGSWRKGKFSRTTYQFEIITILCKELGFNLVQDIYWYNPIRIPAGIVTRKPRLKDSIENIWWLSLSDSPKANNRRVLSPYSDYYKNLIKSGFENVRLKDYAGGHGKHKSIFRNLGGAIPSNLLAVPSVEVNSVYLNYCKTNNLPIHPARFSVYIPYFFIKFLTDENDLVFDPFGGSCTTGEASERLNRRWICTEQNKGYLLGAKGRFHNGNRTKWENNQEAFYKVYHPKSLLDLSQEQKSLETVTSGWEKSL